MLHRKLGEKEKLVRTCAQISSFSTQEPSMADHKNPENDPDLDLDLERKAHFDTMLEKLDEIEEAKHEDVDDVVTDGSEMVVIKSCRVTATSTQKVIPGSEVTLELQVESNFPR